MNHCVKLESQYGVPTAPIITHVFKSVSEQTAYADGMPNLRITYVPQPVMGKSDSELAGYIRGKDPNTDKPVMDEVLAALTKPLSALDQKTGTLERPSPPSRIGPDTEENLQRLYKENGWTDYLPIVLPTEDRVATMLKATSHKPDEIVGRMGVSPERETWSYTVETVAINAVMAGARPEYLPVILAIAASGYTARSSSTRSTASMVVVNGPIRQEINMNWGIGAMGPYNEANTLIGRAYGLLSQNGQGGSVPGSTYMGSQGNNFAYTNLTFAENEEANPWQPLSVRKGFRPDESVVSVFGGVVSTTFTLIAFHDDTWRDQVCNLVKGGDPQSSPPVFVLDPIAAGLFKDKGFDNPAKLGAWVEANCRIPAKLYWDYQLAQNYLLGPAMQGKEPYATWLKAKPDDLIPMYPASQVEVVVVGGGTNGYWRIVGANYVKSISVDKWR